MWHPPGVTEASGFPEELRRDFQPVGLIGRGGMGEVWLAEDRRLGRKVAVKLLRIVSGIGIKDLDPEVARRFVQEGRALGRIRHPSVLEVFSFGETEDGPYLVTEFLEGSTLAEGPAAVPVLPAMLQVAEGLQAVHDAGLFHRDLTPGNVMLTHEGRAVLVDFGLALDPGGSRVTRTGVVLGTAAYMAPELFLGRPFSASADWYSWGATLYEGLRGEPPRKPDDVLAAIGRGQAVPLPDLGGLPLEASRLLAACLSWDPAPRPTSLAEIRALQAGESLSRPGKSGSLRAAWAAWVALGVVAGLAVAWTGDRPGSGALPGPRVEPGSGVVGEDLASEVARLEAEPDLVSALEVDEHTPAPEVSARVSRGRAVLGARATRLGERILAAGESASGNREALGRLSVLVSVLDPPGQDPGGALAELGEILAGRYLGWFQVVGDPRGGALSRDETWQERRTRYLSLLSQGGRRWRTIYRADAAKGRGTGIPDGFLRGTRPGGAPFDPPRTPGAELIGTMREEVGLTRRLSETPDQVLADLDPVHGDLVLALVVYDWEPVLTGVLDLEAAGARLRLAFTPPRNEGRPGEGELRARLGLLLRVAADRIPPGFLRMRLRAVGLPPLAAPSLGVGLDEIHQLVEGAVPEELSPD